MKVHSLPAEEAKAEPPSPEEPAVLPAPAARTSAFQMTPVEEEAVRVPRIRKPESGPSHPSRLVQIAVSIVFSIYAMEWCRANITFVDDGPRVISVLTNCLVTGLAFLSASHAIEIAGGWCAKARTLRKSPSG